MSRSGPSTAASASPKHSPALSIIRLGAGLAAALLIRLLAAGNDSLAFATRAARSGVTVDLRVRSDEAGLRAGLAPAVAAFVVAAGGAGGRADRLTVFPGRLAGEA